MRLRLAQAWALSLSFRIPDALRAIATLRQDMQCPELGLTTQGDAEASQLLYHLQVLLLAKALLVVWINPFVT